MTSTLNLEFVPLVTASAEPMNILIDGKATGDVKDIEDGRFMASVRLDSGYSVYGFGSTREEAVEDAARRGLAEARKNLQLAEEFAAKFE